MPLDQALFLTFTFERAFPGGKVAAWRAAGACWKALRDALAYKYGHGAGRATRKATMHYVQTWEQHADGWPHVHALLWSPAVLADVARHGHYERADPTTGEPRSFLRWASTVLRPMARAAGFGRVLDAQRPRRQAGALAGYLVKLAGELVGTGKRDQTPVQAPRGFRRLRASPRFLPRIRSLGRFTGQLVAVPADQLEAAFNAGAETISAAYWKARARMDAWLRSALAPTAGSSWHLPASTTTGCSCTAAAPP